jgi:hypothetical protein
MNNNKPTLASLVVCDQVITEESTKKHTLLGVFSTIHSNQFPSVHSKFVIFTTWINNDLDQTYNLALKIKDPAGGYLNAKITDFELKIQKDILITYALFNFVNTQFQNAGKHTIELYMNGQLEREFPLMVSPANN